MSFNENSVKNLIQQGLQKGAGATPYANLARQGIKSGRISTFVITGAGVQSLRSKLFTKPVVVTENEIGISYLGTPVYDALFFDGGSYLTKTIDENGNTITQTTSYVPVRADTVLFEVSQAKNIITTQIQGRNGTIKEYISDGDYMITATGAIVNENNVYPETEVRQLVDICNVPEAINIESPFLNNIFGITEVVIMSYNLVQSEGQRNVQLFEIQMQSDIPINLQQFITE